MKYQTNSNRDSLPTRDEFTKEDVWHWIESGRIRIAVVCIATAIAATGASLLLPNIYTAKAAILPPGSQQQSGASAALAAIGALSGGLISGIGSKTPDELYIALLRSQSVARALDEKLKLRERLDIEEQETLFKVLPQILRVTGDKKSGVIYIEADDEDPSFAAKLVNEAIAELEQTIDRLAISDAQARYKFFEQQLNKTKDNLRRAEEEMEEFAKLSGAIALDAQATQIITTSAQIRAQIAYKEVALKVLLKTATPQNPAIAAAELEISELKRELAKFENATMRDGSRLASGKLPETATEFIRLKRELKFQEALLEGLLKQFEAARLDAASDGPSLQVVDKATPPDRKSKPKRSIIVLLATFTVFAASIAWAIYSGRERWLHGQANRDVPTT